MINAKKVLKNIFGATNPKKEKPGKVNEVMVMLVTKTVSKQKIIALIKKENSPRVTRLRGREIIFKTGFTIKKSKDKESPPAIQVKKPP